MMKKSKHLIPLVCAACITQAHASPATDAPQTFAADKGYYVELNGGTLVAATILSSDIYHGGFGANVNAGYQFNRYFAIETGYSYYNPQSNDFRLHLLDLAIKGILPVTDRFNLFGKIGGDVGFALNDDETGPIGGILVGVGGSYAITPQVDLNAQLVGMTIGVASVGLLSGGLTYHFA